MKYVPAFAVVGLSSAVMLSGCSPQAPYQPYVGQTKPPAPPTPYPKPKPRPKGSPTPKFSLADPKEKSPKKVVALTFDDGPGPYTEKVAQVLREKQVPATFFVLGSQIKGNEQTLRRLSEDGFSIQGHTYSHRQLRKQKNEMIRKDLRRMDAAFDSAGVDRAVCVRPPYGSRSKRTDQILSASGLSPILWNVDSEDWTEPGRQRIVDRVLSTVKPGSIILFHDGGGDRSQTVEALPRIIDELKKDGYSFQKLCSGS